MRKSLLYNIHQHKLQAGIKVPEKYFTEAFNSKYGLVRIFKVQNVSIESKLWVANPKNRICDAPGSWYCVGQYPVNTSTSLKKLLQKKLDFGQLEDFNRGGGNTGRGRDYYDAYMAEFEGRRPPRRAPASSSEQPSPSSSSEPKKKKKSSEKKEI